MKKYLIKRILISIFVFFAITLLVYLFSSMTPVSPEDQFITPETTPEDIQRIRERLGVDRPVIIQYAMWMERLFSADLGYSFRTHGPISVMLSESLKVTALLAVVSILVSVIIALPVGIWAAYKPYSVIDYIVSVLSFLGSSIPNFFLALICIFFFCASWGVLPMTGLFTSGGDKSLTDLIRHAILPVFVLSFENTAVLLRHTRSSMLEIFNEEYVRMARLKGLREGRVIFVHVLRNAAGPIVTTVNIMIMALFSGSIVVEQMFSIPGIGNLLMQSVLATDYPVIMSITVVITVIVLAINLLQDIIYGLLDPRIKYD